MNNIQRTLAAASALLLGVPSAALSHTNSIGYVGDGQGGITFWYGSYHTGTTFNEADIKLEGANGTTFTTVITPFTLLENSTPAGLIPGTNYFTTDGTQLIPYDDSTAAGSPSASWQGVTFTGLAAGDYTFTYIPLGDPQSSDPNGTPTMEWAPWDQVIRSATVTLSSSILSGDANGNGIPDVQEFGTVQQPSTPSTPSTPSPPTLVSSAAGTPIVTSSSVTQDRYVFDTAGDTRTYYQDTVTTTTTTPTTVDTYSDGSTVTTNGTPTTSTTTTLATVPVWVETRTYDVQRGAYAPSGAAPTVVQTHQYTATEDGAKQKVNHHTTTGVTTPTVRTVTTTAVYTKVYTDGSPDTVTNDPSVITYETSTSYEETYASKDYFGRIDQLEALDNIGGAINGLLNHEPSQTKERLRVFENNHFAQSYNGDGYTADSKVFGGGMEFDITKGWTIGAQYNTARINMTGSDSRANLRKEHVGIFNAFHGNTLSLNTNAGMANNKYDYTRTVEGVFDNAGKTQGKEWWVTNRLYLHLASWLHPFVGHTVSNLKRDGYTETGDIRSARVVDSVNETTHVGEAGLKLETRFGGKKNDLFGMSVEGSYGTDNSYGVTASVDYREVITIEGTHGVSDGMTTNSIAGKVKFRF